jgi:Ni/Fe-hydrogenase 1 B-type cytochrome subunit
MDATDDVIVAGPSIYVYEAPVRLWHWGNALCITILAVTGYFIGSPPPTMPGEASDSFLFGYIRFAHFAAGQVLAVAFLARILWAFWGNKYSRQIFYLPVWEKTWWKGVIREARWYLFLEKEPYKYIGHNPLAHTAMFAMFTLFNLGMIVTGFALYSEGAGRDSWQAKLFGWVFDIWPNSQDVHTLHHLGMWVIVIFAIVHIYAAVREDIMSRQTMISTMISGERQFRDEREG